MKLNRFFSPKGWESEMEGDSIIKTIIITLGAALAYILLSVSLLIWCRLKRRQRKLQSSSNGVDNDQPDAQTALRKFCF